MNSLPSDVVEELTQIVGADSISTLPQQCDALSRTTLPEGTRPSGVVRPTRRQQVQAILQCAATHGFPVYPISCGKNWGYGDACAPVPGCLILDLSCMNRIVEVNTELAYAVIEPGVTQGELADHLEKHRIPLVLDGNGAGPNASIVGNILDRGFGHSRYGDRLSHCCNMEAVLADGSVVRTGFGSYPDAQAQHVYKWGIGPSLDGLLTQSNLAVITRITVWLMPVPEHLLMFVVTLREAGAIGPFMESIRHLRLQGTLRSTLHCFNDARILAGSMRFPWDQADGKQALEVQNPELFHRLCRKHGMPPWVASGCLTGTRREVHAARKTIQHVLRKVPGIGRLVFVNQQRLSWVKHFLPWLRRFAAADILVGQIENIQLNVNLLMGRPSFRSLKGAHWRARKEAGPTEDPLQSESGMIWVSPVLPMTREGVEDFTEIVEPTFHEFGFEYQVTLSCINDRALCAITTISYDRSSPEETKRAERCCDTLLERLLEKGYVPYRTSFPMSERIRQAAPDYWSKVSQFKKAWDPQGIIAPGRYLKNDRESA